MSIDQKDSLAAWIDKSAREAFEIADAIDIKSPEKLEKLPANTALAKDVSDAGFDVLISMLFPQYLANKTTIELSMARESHKETGGGFGVSLAYTPLNLSYQKRFKNALASSDQLTVYVERSIAIPNI